MLSYIFYYTACFSALFLFAPENLVSPDGFGSPVPPQLFSLSFSQILSYVFYYTACFSNLFSCATENSVSRDGFGSPVPRQLFFFVPSKIGPARVIKTIYHFSTCACWQSKLSGEMHGCRYIERVIKILGHTATVPMQRSGSKNTREIPSARCQN